jgi:hypothetical protein
MARIDLSVNALKYSNRFAQYNVKCTRDVTGRHIIKFYVGMRVCRPKALSLTSYLNIERLRAIVTLIAQALRDPVIFLMRATDKLRP